MYFRPTKTKTMRKLLFLFILISSSSFGQLISGTLVEEGRKVLNNPAFIIEGMANGYAKYELAVNREGKVTSARLVETNLKSTPATFTIKNYVKTFTFQPGTYYPKFHHVVVKITMME